MKTSELLIKLGCRPNNMGYRYICDLVDLAKRGFNISPLCTNGYKILSQKYDKKISCIEKNIQNCISNAWVVGDSEYLYKFFGSTVSEEKGKPTNKHFIFSVINHVR